MILTKEDIGDDLLKKVIENTGYRVLSIKKEPYEKKSLFSRG